MLILLSPAKTLDFKTPPPFAEASQPVFVAEAKRLVACLRKLSHAEVAELMGLSDKLAALNVARYVEWQATHALPEAKQAVLAFDGDVYDGLGAATLSEAQLAGYAQAHIAILSGLYGLLRPLDLIRPYRLEMGSKLANPGGKDLYAFWGQRIAKAINARLDALAGEAREVVNLASEEYFKSVKTSALRGRVVTPVFQEWRGGQYKIISFNAKRARGAMTRFAIEQGVTSAEGLKAFDRDDYAFDTAASDDKTWYFRRRAA